MLCELRDEREKVFQAELMLNWRPSRGLVILPAFSVGYRHGLPAMVIPMGFANTELVVVMVACMEYAQRELSTRCVTFLLLQPRCPDMS